MKAAIAEAVLMLHLCYIAVVFSGDGDFDVVLFRGYDRDNATDNEQDNNQTENDAFMCGVPFLSPLLRNRIVGGHEAQRCVWPWQVSFQRLGRFGWYHTCGGVIIRESWIITAAHCVYDDLNATNYRMIINEFDRYKSDGDEQTFAVRQLIIHDKYVGINTLWDSDIALVQIEGRCPITPCSMPICLPSAADDYVPMKCYATGWGRNIEGGQATRTLHEVELTAFNRSTCNQPTWYANLLTDNMICAGDVNGGRGTCTGDSGGPLACVNQSLTTWILIGVVSWAKIPCAGPKGPTVFTRVSAFVQWINSAIEKS